MTETFDLIVVGGGRASGLAIAAAQSGLKTVLVERDKLGGACPNRGCVPSKLLIGFAEAANRVREAERVLFAIGRRPNTEALELEKTGLAANEQGFHPVDAHLQTAVDGIFAAGDGNGRYMLQHAAAFEVRYLRHKFIKNSDEPIDERQIAHAVFSNPEVASVGLTEEQLKDAGTPYVFVFEDWLASARAMAMRIDYPRIKLLVSPADYSILGCHLVGPESCTLMHQVLAVMHLKNDVRELADMIYIHPGLNECILSAAVNAVAKVRKFNQEY